MFLAFIVGAPAIESANGEQLTDIETLRHRFEDSCFGCHGDGADEGGFSFDALADGSYGDDTMKRWEAVWKNIRAETMPPADEFQPEPDERREWVDWIQKEVFRLDTNNIDPGKVVLRRLNRSEYRETIQQLTGVNFDGNEAFPADDTGYGFDTIGEVLHISPVVLEKYLLAAESIIHDTIPLEGATPPEQRFWSDHLHLDSPEGEQSKTVKFDQSRDFHLVETLKKPGDYEIAVRWEVNGAWTNTGENADLILLHHVDKENTVEIGKAKAGFFFETKGDLRGKVTVTDKPLHVSIRFKPLPRDADAKTLPEAEDASYSFRISNANVVGPLNADEREYRKGSKILVGGPPPIDADEEVLDQMSRVVLERFALRAFRRPIDDRSLDRLVAIARETRTAPDSGYEHGLAASLKLILASPRFLFRIENSISPNQLTSIPPNTPVSALGDPIDDYALATRMSYFLWGGPPDDELLRLAGEGKLRQELDAQIKRMIGDEWRMRTGVSNFVGQWLKTRDVTSVSIDVRRVLAYRGDEKDFSWQVRDSMKQETETLFRYLIEENRPIEELLNANYSFLNEPLAKFYGIDGVKGDQMRKVDLPADSHRKGILTHGSMLLVTSNPTRTSPVKRGLFILENLLGTPAPPAPPNVPALEDSKSGDMKNASLREILEFHRREPMCASCHRRMDPLGLALENYNAIGQYREMELGLPGRRGREAEPDKEIDPTGVLMTGEKFSSVVELADVLANDRREDFYRCLTEKMLVFALGRGLTFGDATTVDQIVAKLKADDGQMQTLIESIIRSVPFTHQPKSDSVALISAD
ncbi:hypothetical protein Poly59_35180 [Rubripirellula reticaptiva]|uniref:Planctomycete cytochrome C n=2 Tax=Rubripirellula reticaptiva TaxID=2528013 RepID=A0A5C6ESD3_9BACT|nr:hypothetical protein Poly59_35180 [Rubripirellula reticaptiva]